MQALAVRALLSVAVVVASSSAAATVHAVDSAVDAPSNVPGALWAGGSIVSTAGGPVIDRVWRLELPVGRVAIINLTGAPGSELGLYLYDAYTASILSEDPIAQSARPGGAQRLNAVLPAGTYYVNVNGRNTDRTYSFTLSALLLPDNTPPTLSLRPVPNGAFVNSSVAAVQVLASDLLSGVSRMRLRADGGEWGEWLPAALSAQVAIRTEPGAHRIEAQVANGLGLVSATAATIVRFDNTPPTAVRSGVRSDGSTLRATPSITYTFNEAMRASSWTSGGLIVLNRNGSVVSGSFAYDDVERTGSWKANEPLLLGEPYAVQLGSVVDLAGNAPAQEPAWVLQYQLGTAIRVETTAVAATYLSNRLMIGLLSGIPAGAAVRLQQRLPGEEWTNYGEYYAATGIVRVKYPVAQTASWRLLYEGDAAHRAATGPTVAVKVAPQLLLSGAGGYVRQRLSGAVVRIVGAVSPVSAAVTLVRYRCNALFASCVVSARISVAPDTTGAVSYEWKATRGYWIWKLQSAAGLGLEYATTAKLRFSVR